MGNIKTGILGMGAVSTLHYIKRLNEVYSNSSGSDNTFPFILLNTDFSKVNRWLPNHFEKIEAQILPYLKNMESFGIEQLIVPNITIHETIDRILKTTSFTFQFAHPLSILSEKLLKEGITDVYILGTRYTMEQGYLSGYLSRFNIQTHLMNEEMKDYIDGLRKAVYDRNDLDLKAVKNKLITFFGRHDIVLACTELSVLFSSFNSVSLKYYDMAEEQINYIINKTT